MRIKVSKYAKPLYTEDFYEVDLWGGRGRGGSHGVTQYALIKMMTDPYFRGYFVRAIQGTVRDSLWQDFKDRINEVSELNGINLLDDFRIVDNEMTAVYIPNGNTIKSKGFKASSKSNTANMKSIAGATHVIIEECEEVGREEYNKLADSLRTIKAPVKIIRSWNAPAKSHWLVKDYFDLVPSGMDGYYSLKPKGIKNHLSIFGTYKDNIKNLDVNTIARYERYKETSPRYYYNQILGFVSDGGDKKVFYNWRRISFNDFLAIDAPQCYGVDFGDTAPCSVQWIKYKDGCFYSHEVLYKSLRSMAVEYGDHIAEIRERLSCEIPDNDGNNIWTKHKGLLTYVFELIGIDKEIPMFCDPAQSGLIVELRLAGFKALQATKDKKANINFINRASNFYTKDSVNTEAEYESYYLEEDINKDPIDGKPKKGNDHAMESREYGVIGLKDALGIIL